MVLARRTYAGPMRTRPLAIAALGAALGALLIAAAGSAALGPYPSLGSCGVFPRPDASVPANAPSAADESAWNQDISQAPLDPNSTGYIAYINAHGGDSVHPDFGSPPEYGFPYAVVGKKQKRTRSTSPPTATSPTTALTASR